VNEKGSSPTFVLNRAFTFVNRALYNLTVAGSRKMEMDDSNRQRIFVKLKSISADWCWHQTCSDSLNSPPYTLVKIQS